tara:strand:- start:1495 stop:1845 length:351 start_codon:yes stop_codon:yes gene_type:complete
MRTEIRNGERVWTEASIERILFASKYVKQDPDAVHDDMRSLLRDSLKEAGFTETITQDNLNGWSLELDHWGCYIKLIKPVDSGCVVVIGIQQYDVDDLIFLWDKIRKTWVERSLSL